MDLSGISLNDQQLYQSMLNMQLCKQGIAKLKAISAANDAIKAENDARIQAATNDFNARQHNFDNCIRNSQNDHNNRVRDWDNCRNHEFDECRRYVGETGCNSNCNDNEETLQRYGGGCPWGQSKAQCQNSRTYCENRAFDKCGRDRPNYSNTCGNRPTLNPPVLKQQNQTNVTVKCCSNVVQIIGSQVTNTTIDQANNCSGAFSSTTNRTPTPTTPVQNPTTTTPVTTPVTTPTNSNTMIIIIIIIIVISISSIIIFFIFYKPKHTSNIKTTQMRPPINSPLNKSY